MSDWKIYTPEGVQDILFEDCFTKRNLEQTLRLLFRSYGYPEIESPTLEFYDVFTAGKDMTPQEMMFKFFDPQGRILVLRPDMTIPVARIAATKLKEATSPLRFSYIGNTFRYNEMGGGKQKEFTQAGVEILGAGRPEADAEVIAMAVNAMNAAGIDNFQIDIGQVEFFKGLMEETGLSESDTGLMRTMVENKDFPGFEELAGKFEIPSAWKDLILELPRLFGPAAVIDRAEKAVSNRRSREALANLRQVVDILKDYGLDRYIAVDLGMLQSLHYYTGIIFRGFTHGVGFPVLSGGRYDTLVEKFGQKCPATGFSMGINLVMTALERQKTGAEKPAPGSLVCYDEGERKLAIELCQILRKQGLTIEMDITGDSPDAVAGSARRRGISGIIRVLPGGGLELCDLATGETKTTSMSHLGTGFNGTLT